MSHPQASTGDPAGSVLVLERLHKRFGALAAVDGVDLAIRRGEFFSLLGPSGCGKTTVLRLIAGFEQPDSGRVLLDGADLAGVPPYRRSVNTVFQQYALFPHLDVFDNVAFGPRARGLAAVEVRRRVEEMLEVVRLDGLASRRPDRLSGGQRQRVALARALVNSPSAVLLDEPLSALDLQLRREMQSELRRIQRRTGITFVLVTHDQEEAWTLSDRTAVMSQGRIEQIGSPQELYREPATAFVAGFIGEANWLDVRAGARRSDRVEVELDGGASFWMPASAVPDAPSLSMMVRLEHVRVHATRPEVGAQTTAALPVVIVDSGFHGAWMRCQVRDDAGRSITALLRDDTAPAGAAGDRAWASWDVGNVRLFPRG